MNTYNICLRVEIKNKNNKQKKKKKKKKKKKNDIYLGPVVQN